MNETPWERLYRLAEARREHLGKSRADVKASGGPSSESVRKLKNETGAPSVRQATGLRALDHALDWPPNTSWGLVTVDRSNWTADALEDEEEVLIFGDGDVETPAEQRNFETIVHRMLTNMHPERREAVMADIAKLLGFDIAEFPS